MAQVTQQCQDDYRNKCVFSFRRNDNSHVAEVTSRGRVFQILGPAVANERSPTVTWRDGRTSRRLVDDDRRRVLAGISAKLFGQVARIHHGIVGVHYCVLYVYIRGAQRI